MKKCCVYNTKKVFFVELYAPEKLLILQFFNEEDAMKFVDKYPEIETEDIYKGMDELEEKLLSQIRKEKTKMEKSRREGIEKEEVILPEEE